MAACGGKGFAMFKGFTDDRSPLTDVALPAGIGARLPAPSFTVVIPFFNERDFLPDTIASLARQTVPFELVLVDNASTDGSAEVARETCRRFNIVPTLIREARRGKVAALQAGLAEVRTRYVATCDADTWYPEDYLAQAGALLDQPGCVGAGAYFAPREADARTHIREGLHVVLASRLLPGQCHAGGAGQAFDTAALRRAGGFDPRQWNLVLEDHEVIHRVLKQGAVRYSLGLWCAPSPRPRDRVSVAWTLVERLAYHALVGRTGDWFFRDFLGPRLKQRKLSSERLRETVHLSLEADNGTSYALC